MSVVRQEVDEEQVYPHHILFGLSSPPRYIILTADKIADKSVYVDILTLTFSHLADALIQSDLQYVQGHSSQGK